MGMVTPYAAATWPFQTVPGPITYIFIIPTKESTRNDLYWFYYFIFIASRKKMAYIVVGEEVGDTKTGSYRGKGNGKETNKKPKTLLVSASLVSSSVSFCEKSDCSPRQIIWYICNIYWEIHYAFTISYFGIGLNYRVVISYLRLPFPKFQLPAFKCCLERLSGTYSSEQCTGFKLRTFLLCPPRTCIVPLAVISSPYRLWLISHLGPSRLPDLLSRCHSARVQVTLILFNNVLTVLKEWC